MKEPNEIDDVAPDGESWDAKFNRLRVDEPGWMERLMKDAHEAASAPIIIKCSGE